MGYIIFSSSLDISNENLVKILNFIMNYNQASFDVTKIISLYSLTKSLFTIKKNIKEKPPFFSFAVLKNLLKLT